jgi:hypothetical protein
VRSVRIDGTTPSAERHRLVTAFQTDPSVTAAVLGVTSAGQGITLTAATTVGVGVGVWVWVWVWVCVWVWVGVGVGVGEYVSE